MNVNVHLVAEEGVDGLDERKGCSGIAYHLSMMRKIRRDRLVRGLVTTSYILEASIDIGARNTTSKLPTARYRG